VPFIGRSLADASGPTGIALRKPNALPRPFAMPTRHAVPRTTARAPHSAITWSARMPPSILFASAMRIV